MIIDYERRMREKYVRYPVEKPKLAHVDNFEEKVFLLRLTIFRPYVDLN